MHVQDRHHRARDHRRPAVGDGLRHSDDRCDVSGTSERIAALKKQKLDVLAEASLPVPGLEITDTGLTHDGITDENWSQSESLKISMLLADLMSKRPITVFRISGFR